MCLFRYNIQIHNVIVVPIINLGSHEVMGNTSTSSLHTVHFDDRQLRVVKEKLHHSHSNNEMYHLHWYADSFLKWEQSIRQEHALDFLVSYFGIETLFLISDLFAFIELVFDFDYVTSKFHLVEKPVILQTVSLCRENREQRDTHGVLKKSSPNFLPITLVFKTSKIDGLQRVKSFIATYPKNGHLKRQSLSFPKGVSISVPQKMKLSKFGSKILKSHTFQRFCILALRAKCDSHFLIIQCVSGTKLYGIKALVAFDIHPIDYIESLNNRMYFPYGFENVMKTFTKERSPMFQRFFSQHAEEECGMIRTILVNENNLASTITIPILHDKSSFETLSCDYGMRVMKTFSKLQKMALHDYN